MKLSCLPVSFYNDIQNGDMSIGRWASIARQEGLDAIDLSVILISNHTSKYLNYLKNDISSEGMSVTMITTYPDFTHPDRQRREREIEYTRYDIAISAELGAKYLRILAGQAHPNTSVESGISLVVDSFKQLDEVASRHNVKLLFENHSKPSVWQYNDFSHPTDIFLEIFEKLKDTDIGINFDTGNTLVYGDDPLPVMEQVIERIETIHVADTAQRGKLAPVVIGEGIVPIENIFTRLKEHGFDGWLCIEEASGKGRAGLSAAIQAVKSKWSSA